jgi:acyl-CoA synthetase (AMP-forming)/AMP-acid ligase II
MSMSDIFERRRWSEPDRIVLTGHRGAAEEPSGESVTVAEADDRANQFANALLGAGAEPGQILVMICDNSLESVLVKIGAAKAGVTIAPINPNLSTEVMRQLIDDMGARWAVIDAEFATKITGMLNEVGARTVATISVGGPQPAGATTFSEFINGSSVAEPDIVIHGDDIWQIQFTSGTSALPKGVMGSHMKTMVESLSSMGIVSRGQRFEFDVIAGVFVPVTYHVSEVLIYSAVLCGGRAIIGRKPDARELARAIDHHGITSLHVGSPQMLEALDSELRNDPGLESSSVTSVLHSFAPLRPESYVSAKEALGSDALIVGVIGQTEMCVMHRFWIGAAEELHADTSPRENYVGRPHPMAAAALMSREGELVESGTGAAGEGVYRSPALMAGYFNNSDATAEAFADGWFHGGDAFSEGEDGLRKLDDRIKDVIKTGGENVSSLRVESVMSGHPAVERAVAIGLPHPRWGEAVTVLVHLLAGSTVDERELIEFARGRLAGFETPKAVLFVDSFPETVGNKVKKHELRMRYADLYTDVS